MSTQIWHFFFISKWCMHIRRPLQWKRTIFKYRWSPMRATVTRYMYCTVVTAENSKLVKLWFSTTYCRLIQQVEYSGVPWKWPNPIHVVQWKLFNTPTSGTGQSGRINLLFLLSKACTVFRSRESWGNSKLRRINRGVFSIFHCIEPTFFYWSCYWYELNSKFEVQCTACSGMIELKLYIHYFLLIEKNCSCMYWYCHVIILLLLFFSQLQYM